MGSSSEDKDARVEEYPQHLVSIQSFLMGKYPVTQDQWAAVSYLSKVNIGLASDPSFYIGYNFPVQRVNWYKALEFCNRLSIFTGLNIILPSEAQWEYACKAGTTTPYYCGDNITPELANYYYNKDLSIMRPTSVKRFPSNPYDLYGMHGNLNEWCLDHWHDNYEGAPTDGSPWLDNNSNTQRVARGGSYKNGALNCRSTSRFGTLNITGLRICCSI